MISVDVIIDKVFDCRVPWNRKRLSGHEPAYRFTFQRLPDNEPLIGNVGRMVNEHPDESGPQSSDETSHEQIHYSHSRKEQA